MLLYLARATQVMDLEIHYPHTYLDNIGTLHTSLDDAQRALGIALMHERASGSPRLPPSSTRKFVDHIFVSKGFKQTY